MGWQRKICIILLLKKTGVQFPYYLNPQRDKLKRMESKNKNKLIMGIIIFFSTMLINYLAFSFMMGDFNPMNYVQEIRVLQLIVFLFMNCLLTYLILLGN